MAELLCVTLDGPAGVGKTTLARRLAQSLQIAYLDTGAMYRVAALALGEPAPTDEASMGKAVAQLHFALEGTGADSVLLLDGRPLGPEIRTEETARLASNAAKIPAVREALKAAQQAIGCATPLVAEGRDMGTVVFPNARRKFFLDAAPEERAKRRLLQLQSMGESADYDAILQAIRERDDQDRNRAAAPLKPADDAIIIDTTNLDVDGVFQALLTHLQ
jgi:cytidylate kinase